MGIQKTYYGFLAGSITLSIICFSVILVKYVAGIALTPTAMFWMLALPPVWFYIRSEYLFHVPGNSESEQVPGTFRSARHFEARNTSIVLLICLLVFYIYPSLFQPLFFPEYSPDFFHYSQHAPIALGIGLLLIRLHALGGGAFLVFVGILVEIAAIFFLGTRIPEWILGEIEIQAPGKTFEFFSLIMICLSYFFLFTTRERGVLKQALIKLGNIQDELWKSLRTSLFPFLLVACHFLFFLTLNYPADQQYIGIIFLLLAGLWGYTGYYFRNILFYSLAYIEIVAAIFSCRFFYAFWPEIWIIWLLLVLFIGLTPLYSLFLKDRYTHATGSFYLWTIVTAALIIYEHITFYGLQSSLGILVLFILWMVTFGIPVEVSARTQPLFNAFLGVFLYCPALFFFLLQGVPSIDQLPRVVLVAVLTSCLIIAYRVYNFQWLADSDVHEFRIAHHLHWFLIQPYSLVTVFFLSTLAVFVVHLLNYYIGPDLFTNQLFPMLVVQGILVVYWFDLARKTRHWWWTMAAETMVAGVILTLRQELPRVFGIQWTDHEDMFVGWFVALTITLLRPLLKHQDKSIRIPIRYTLFGLPLITVMYALDYAVDFEFFSMIILPLYSVLFLFQAYSEKDRFVLAYAFLGINSYLILLLLHNQIQSLQAYITPVCISILIFVQVFRDITTKTTANFVRAIALFILLGVAMFQAIVENYLSPLPHLILITLSSLAIVSAGVLRIRIFATAGLFCFIVDLIAIIYIVLSRQDTETLKVILGIGLTLGGGLILTGYILYRKNQERVEAFVARMKSIFYSWE